MTLFNDVDGDGVFDSEVDTVVDDPAQSGVQPFVVTTDEDGNYVFEGLAPGDYLVVETQPDDLASLSDEDENQGSESGPNDFTNGDLGDDVIPVTVASNEVDSENNFVEATAIGVGNLVFEDVAGDGDFDDGTDVALNGVTVELYRDNGDGLFNETSDTLVGTDETGSEGDYLILAPVNPQTGYFVHIPAENFGAGNPVGALTSSLGAGTDNEVDDGSDENGGDVAFPATSGVTSVLITLVPGAEPTGETSANPCLLYTSDAADE